MGEAQKIITYPATHTMKNNLKLLTREIHELIVQVDSNENNTTEIQNKLEEKQKELEELIQEQSNVIYYKNITIWMEYREKCTKFFLNLTQQR